MIREKQRGENEIEGRIKLTVFLSIPISLYLLLLNSKL
jgi:hypothetical protein